MSVSGAGGFLSAENGDETDFTWFRSPSRKTYNGLLSALVRATTGASGDIEVKFESDGLPAATAHVAARPQKLQTGKTGEIR